MQLANLHTVSQRLAKIDERFGTPLPRDVNDTATTNDIHELDRFFWLQARQKPGGAKGHEFFSALCPKQSTPGYRICNLVLQGGGTLGLAHAGFIAGLERAGIRFAGLAGTSAGSILAMGIAAIRGHDLTRETHNELVSIVESVPMDQFIDGPRPVRKLIKRALKMRPLYTPQHWYGWLVALRRLRDHRGLNQGVVFEAWLETELTDLGFGTIGDLYDALQAIWASLTDRGNWTLSDADADLFPFPKCNTGSKDDEMHNKSVSLLQLITTAMPVGSKFKLPEDLKYLSREYERISPAKLVRTSMSIPAFFEPVQLQTHNTYWREHVRTNLADLLSREQTDRFSELDELVFLDGGMVSNLPSDAFRDLMPSIPTIVVPLVGNQEKRPVPRRPSLARLKEDVAACATAVRIQRDREIWLQNSELKRGFEIDEERRTEGRPVEQTRKYNVVIAPVDTGEVNWLNFVMSDAEKVELFEAGLKRAEELLANLSRAECSQNEEIAC